MRILSRVSEFLSGVEFITKMTKVRFDFETRLSFDWPQSDSIKVLDSGRSVMEIKGKCRQPLIYLRNN